MLRKPLAGALLAALVALIMLSTFACAKRHHISIESNTCWTAFVDQENSSIANDCGSVNFRVAGEIHCVAVTNANDTGFVRVRIDDGLWVENATPRGTAKACR